MKKTAIDYLYEQFISLFMQYTEDDTGEFNFGELITEAHEQAKEMEKQQIMDAYNDGSAEWTAIEYTDAEQYYNETYNQ
jgi:hypothetical protein